MMAVNLVFILYAFFSKRDDFNIEKPADYTPYEKMVLGMPFIVTCSVLFIVSWAVLLFPLAG